LLDSLLQENNKTTVDVSALTILMCDVEAFWLSAVRLGQNRAE